MYLRAETSASYVRQYGWAYYCPYVSVDSNGYPYVAYRRYSYYSYPFVTKSSFNNGTWQTASGFPYQLRTSSSWYWRASVLPLTEGKIYVLYNNRYTTYGRLWNVSTWEAEETVTTTYLQQPQYFSAVTEGDDIHFAFVTTSPYNINYRKRTYGTGWGSEVTIQSSTTSTSAPVLSINTANNDLYCFWAGKSQYVDVTAERAGKKSIRFVQSDEDYTYQYVTYTNETLTVTAPLSGSRGDDVGVWVDLPWNFTYYGANKTRIYLCTNGFGVFDVAYNGYSNSLSEMRGRKMIAPFWDDLRTDVNADDGIYAENKTDRVVFYWKTTRYGASADKIKMQLVLFQDGTIQFNWDGVVNLDNFSPTCGLGNMKDHIYGKKSVSGTWDTSPTDWIDESAEILTSNDVLTSFYQDYGNKIGLAYLTKTASPYNVKHKYLNLAQPALDLNGTFIIDINTYPLTYVHGIEIQLRCRASYSGEKLYLKALNWTSMTYSDSGFNSTAGQTQTINWNYYNINVTHGWRSYVRDDGTICIKLQDQALDINQTTIDIDFLGIRAVIDGACFIFKNSGSLTTHLVSLWIINSTVHQRYDISVFINSGGNFVLFSY